MTIEIIAELGSNPRRENEWAYRTATWQAKEAGATAVKVQVFKAEHFPEAEWEGKRPFVFPRDELQAFADYAVSIGLKAGASVFDYEAVTRCALHMDFLKLAAREQYNGGLMGHVKRAKLPFYRSVSDWVAVDPDWRAVAGERCTHFWTIPEYPASILKSVWQVFNAARFFNDLKLKWGWSSHTAGDVDCVLAVALGATVIEKHFATRADEVEAAHSLLPGQFKQMVRMISKVS